jgi:ketosteroid isomerase-like protein
MTSAHPLTSGRVLLALPLALLVACAASKPPATTPAGALARAAVPVERAQQEALAADAAFSAASMGRDQRAFAAFLARDAVFVGRAGVSAGIAAVCNDWAPLLTAGGPTLSWKPDSARASTGGDLVVTQGTWALQPAGDGEVRTGRYVTAWERGADGKLKVALDASDTPLPPGSAGAERRPLKRVLSEDERLGAVAGLLLEGSREVGGFMLVEVREGDAWRVVAEVGSYRPSPP